MVILSIALAAVLRCYTNGLKSVSFDRKMTQGILLAQELLEEFETEPPESDRAEGDFGPELPDFSYLAEFERVDIKYRDLKAGLHKRELEPMRKVTVKIYHKAPSALKATLLLDFETYLTGVEKYAPNTKNLNALF